jgi:hypothetical protein
MAEFLLHRGCAYLLHDARRESVGWLLLFPVVLIGSAAVASFAFVRLSSVRITNAGVEIRNFPQAPRVIPLARIDRFVPAERVGMFSSLRPATAVLLMTDGARVPVRAVSEPDAGYGVDALNQRLAVMLRRDDGDG